MSCVSTPTATQFSTSVATSVTTSFSAQVTTLAGTTSTDLSTSCLSSALLSVSGNSTDVGLASCVSSTVITSTTVIGGEVSTAQVPVEITNFVTSSVATNTLFAPCTPDTSTTTTSTSTTSSTTTSSSTSTTTSASASTEFSQSLTTVLTTPTTTFTTASSSTLDNGSVTLVTLTLTSTLPPTSSVQSSAIPIATIQSNDGNVQGSPSSNMGAIIGGSLGGFLGLLGIVGAIWYFCRRRTNWDDIFEKDYEEYAGGKPLAPARGRMLDLEDEPIHVNAAEANTEPKPYVYGLVGSASAISPPSLNAGLAPTSGSRPTLAGHNRSSSMTPLMANGAPASRPVSGIDGNGDGNGGGLSPSPSFTPSASGGRSGSPGPLGVAIPTGPAFGTPPPVDAESPTSITAPRGALFIANQEEYTSPPGSPTSPGPVIGGPSFAGAMAGVGVGGAPPSAFTEKQRLQHNDSVSSHSVYSQASRAQSPPVGSKGPGAGQRRTSAGVVVHTDAGRAEPSDQPPAYLG